MNPSGDIRFDGWTLRSKSGELLNQGTRIRLQDQPLHILEELLARPGEVVTREQLIVRLWPKGVVDFDTALNAAVRRLRAALGDEVEKPRYIETIPRRGYRFIGTVVPPGLPAPGGAVERAPSGGEPSRRRWHRPAIASLLLVLGIGAIVWYAQDQEVTAPVSESPPPTQATVKSIAVLPFVDLSPEQDQQYFADGLSQELLNLLAQTRQLRVTARTSSFSFKGENVDIATVAKKLNVTHVIEGSVRKSGNRVRITAQLIDAATSSHLWSQTYDRELDDIFEVQTDIAASVANALRVALGDNARPSVPGNAQAYEHLLRAHFFFQRRAPGDVERAGQYYQQALEIDPDFARAWAGLAGVYWIQTTDGVFARDTGLEKVRDAAERALALDPALAEAHFRLANYLWAIGDSSSSAAEHVRKATALEPNNPLALGYATRAAVEDGQFDEAIELLRRAVAADPLSAVYRGNLATHLFLFGRLDEAKSEQLKVLELDPTRPADIVGFVLILKRQFDEALGLIESWPEGEHRTQCLALVYHGLGRKDDADAALEALIKSSGTIEPYRLAEVYAYRGEIEEAFKWLQTATENYRDQPFRAGRGPPWIMRLSPFLKSLHTDARWDAWVASTQ